MKHAFCLFLLLMLPVLGDERILSYESVIVVEKNGDLVVTEKIQVRAEGNKIKRGIFRDIPRLHQSKWGLKTKKPFAVLSVKKDGRDENFVTEEIGQGGIRIRIGNANKFLKAGVYTYQIKYRTGRQLYFEKERDALYWNVNGTEWDFPIDKVSATVVLPKEIKARKAWGYTGKRKEEGEDYRAQVSGNVATFATTRGFGKKENLTIVLEWPPGLLDKAAYQKAEGSLLRDHPGVLLGGLLLLGALLYNLFAWVRVGRDPEKGVIIPRFEPPEGFSPAAVRYLDRMGFDNTCFSAGVVGLAVKGVARIEQKSKKDYKLVNLGNGHQREALHPDELRLYNKLLGTSPEIELKQRNHKKIGAARKGLQKMLSSKIEKTHFLRNLKWWLPGLFGSLLGALVFVAASGASGEGLFLLLWLSIWTIGTSVLVSNCVSSWRRGGWGAALFMTLFSVPFVAGWVAGAVAFWYTAGPWPAVAFVCAGVMNVVFYHLIKAPTHHGRKVMDEIEGFKHYLEVAEEERLNLENPPEKTPALFERFLPYALALDCEQKWSEKFDEVLKVAGAAPGGGHHGSYHPTFYTGSYTGMDSVMGAAAIGGALTGALASSSSAPSSGGSGGGGGFSGGGGGGGGGGGW